MSRPQRSLEIHSRLPDVGTTIFTIMSKMAADLGAINLSQGFPDFPIDEKIVGLVNKYMVGGHNQYAPMPGVPALGTAVENVVQRTYRLPIQKEKHLTITAGATEAIFAAISAFINPGDEVILFDPSYDSYDPAIRLNGGIPIHLELRPPAFGIDWDEVRNSITTRTRMIMINTPHNPTGSILRDSDLRALEEIVLHHGLIVVSDEVYERIIFDGNIHESVLRYPGLFSQSVVVFSFGKTFHATGWKVGYAVAPEALTTEIRKTHQFITFSVNTPVQLAIAEYLEEPSHYESLGRFFERKRDFFLEQIEGSPFVPIPSYGSYFQLVSYEGFSGLPEYEMAVDITQRHGVASIPVSVFYRSRRNQNLLRFCFAKKDETLARAGEILRKI